MLIVALLVGLACPACLAEADDAPESGDAGANGEKPAIEWEEALLDIGFSDFAESAETLGGVDARSLVRQLMTGRMDWEALRPEALAARLGESIRAVFLDLLAALAVPVLSGLALRMLLGGKGGNAIALLCRLTCATLLMARYARDGQLAADMLQSSARLSDAVVPVLSAALTLSGSAGSAILSPSSALLGGLVRRALEEAALPLCGVAAIVASAANLSGHFRLNRLFDLFRRVIVTGMRLLIAAFVGLMAFEGLLVSGQEGAASRVVRRAIQGTLPIIGGQLSDSAGALMGSAAALKNAVGLTGAAAILGACLEPLLRIAASMLALRLTSAVLEPVADPGIVATTAHFSELSRMLLAVCAGCALLCVLMIGACLSVPGAL